MPNLNNFYIILQWLIGYYLQIIPVAILCIYPFRGSFKVTNREFYLIISTTIIVMSIVFIGVVSLEFLTHGGVFSRYVLYGHLIFLLTILILLLVYIGLIKTELIYKIFVFLMGMNYGAAVEIIIRTLVDYFNFNLIDTFYPKVFLMFYFILNGIFLYPMIRLMNTIKICFESGISQRIWRSLTVILFGIIIVLIIFYDLPYASYINSQIILSIFISALSIFVFFLYYWILKVIRTERFQALDQNRWKTLAQIYKLDEEYSREVRELRHEVRHHLTALRLFINNSDLLGAQEYLEKFELLENDLSVRDYSADKLLNLLLSDYSQRMQSKNINSQFDISVHEHLNINEIDLIQLFANILDNAIEAVERIKDNKLIKLIIKKNGNFLTISCLNSYSIDNIKKSGDQFISTKLQTPKEMHGIGISVIKEITEKYNGFTKIENDENYFNISVNLCLI